MTETLPCQESIALIDLDGTVADYVGQMTEDLNKLRHPDEPILDSIWDDERLYMKERMNLIKERPGWWRNLPVIERGMEVVNLMRELQFRLHVLTKGPKYAPAAWTEKVEWCAEYLPDAHPFICQGDPKKGGGKNLVYGRVLFDDYPAFMDAWLAVRPRGLGIMLTTETNLEYTHPNVVKYDGTNLHEVRRALVLALMRKPYEALNLGVTDGVAGPNPQPSKSAD